MLSLVIQYKKITKMKAEMLIETEDILIKTSMKILLNHKLK